VEVESNGVAPRMEETLRSVIAVRPEVLVLSAVPDRAPPASRGPALLEHPRRSGLPAQSAAQSITALVQLGVPPQVLAGSLSAVTCQRLVRQVCVICRQPSEPPAPQTLAYHASRRKRRATLKFFRGKGCPTCNKVGYRGRRAIFEVLTGAARCGPP
jgi:hypothetical protein